MPRKISFSPGRIAVKAKVLTIFAASWFASICLSAAQSDSIFQTVKPEITFAVHKHQTGADLVTVTVLDPGYSPKVLAQQLDAIGANLGTAPRGLQVFSQSYGASPNLRFLKASFGIYGLIEGSGHFNIDAIARAFYGDGDRRAIHGLSILFEEEKPSSDTLSTYAFRNIRVEGRYNKPPDAGYEFRVALDDGPGKMEDIPDRLIQIPVKKPVEAPDNRPILLWVLLLAGGFFFGALVYLALLRRRPRRR